MDPLTEEIEEHNNKQQGEGNGVVSMAIQLGDHHISLEKLEKLQTIGTLCHFFSFICAVLVWGHPDHPLLGYPLSPNLATITQLITPHWGYIREGLFTQPHFTISSQSCTL